MTTLAFGNLLRMDGKADIEGEDGGYVVAQHRFQNFFIGKEIVYGGENYMFLPFGFSGVTINRSADGMEATLVFPNQRSGSFEAGQIPAGHNLTTNWADEAVKHVWRINVKMMTFDDPDSTAEGNMNLIHEYTSLVTGGKFEPTTVTLNLSTVLDAVGSDVPMRSLNQRLVGNIPTSSAVRLQ